MGLRLSLDSSESDSTGGPACTSNQSRCSTHTSNNPNPRRDGVDTPSSSTTSSRRQNSLENLIRDLERGNADESNLLRLVLSNPSQAVRIVNRLERIRSNSAASDTSAPSASRSVRAPRNAPRHNRSSWISSESEHYIPSRRTRRSAPSEANLINFDSSESDNEESGSLHNLRFSSMMLRHLQLDSNSSRRGPQSDNALFKALRASAARLSYNVDRLTQNKGECAICLEDMDEGCQIARLPCLCIYHKKCIDLWFEHRAVCPEHPGD